MPSPVTPGADPGPKSTSVEARSSLPQDTSSDAPVVAIIERAIDEVMDTWRARHGIAIADLIVEGLPPNSARITGHVLVPSQAVALERSVRASVAASGLATDTLQFDVQALTDPSAPAEWLRASDSWLDIVVAPGDGAALTTQWNRAEPPIRALLAKHGWLAVELADRTVGWVREAAVESVPMAERPPSVSHWRDGWSGWADAAPPTAWAEALAPWLGAPYRLGGRRHSGVDCSALTQRIFAEVLGMGLPRHSKDQVRFGQRVGRFELLHGDLIYATHAERGLSHVAFVVSLAPDGYVGVGHAGIDHGHVVEEPLTDFLARYVFRAARRFPPGFHPPVETSPGQPEPPRAEEA